MSGSPSFTWLRASLLTRIVRLRSNNSLPAWGKGVPDLENVVNECISSERLAEIEWEILAPTVPNLRETRSRRDLQNGRRREGSSRGVLRPECQDRAGEQGRTRDLARVCLLAIRSQRGPASLPHITHQSKRILRFHDATLPSAGHSFRATES